MEWSKKPPFLANSQQTPSQFKFLSCRAKFRKRRHFNLCKKPDAGPWSRQLFQGFDEKKWAAGEMFSGVKKSCVHPNILSDNMDQIKVCHSGLRVSPDISDGFSTKDWWICFALYSFTFLLLSTLTQSALYWLSRKRGYFWSSMIAPSHPQKEHYKESESCWTQIWQNNVNLFDCTNIFFYIGLNDNELYICLSLVSESFFLRLRTGREICIDCIKSQEFPEWKTLLEEIQTVYWKVGQFVQNFFFIFGGWEVLVGLVLLKKEGILRAGSWLLGNMGKKGGGEYWSLAGGTERLPPVISQALSC